MFHGVENSPPQAENFWGFQFSFMFGKAILLKESESFRGQNPKNFPPAAGFPPGGRENP